MKLKTEKKHYILLVAICFTLIGLIAAFWSPYYENSAQGTHEKGVYNLLQYVSNLCLIIASFSFMGFIVLLPNMMKKDTMDTS